MKQPVNLRLLGHLFLDDDFLELEIDLCFLSLALLQFDPVELGGPSIVVHLIVDHQLDEVLLNELHAAINVVSLPKENVINNVRGEPPPL